MSLGERPVDGLEHWLISTRGAASSGRGFASSGRGFASAGRGFASAGVPRSRLRRVDVDPASLDARRGTKSWRVYREVLGLPRRRAPRTEVVARRRPVLGPGRSDARRDAAPRRFVSAATWVAAGCSAEVAAAT